MIIPNEPAERLVFLRDLLRKCEVSLDTRSTRYKRIRRFFLYGSDSTKEARYNKIWHSLRLKASFIYSQRATRFSIDPGPEVDESVGPMCEIASRVISNCWRDSDGARQFATAVFWAQGYGAMFVKLGWVGGRLVTWIFEPRCFGVLREECPKMDDQEAVSFKYYSPKSDILRALLTGGRSAADIQSILDNLSVAPGSDEEQSDTDAFSGRIVISQSQPTMIGAITGITQPAGPNIEPMVAENLAEMREIWVWDDSSHDYQVFTIALPDTIIFDRPASQLFVCGEKPFVGVVPVPLYDYFWGFSEGQQLIPLQQWREKRMSQLDKLWERQLKPPVFATGLTGNVDEKYAAAMRSGGVISNQLPTGKFEPLTPQMPPEPFSEVLEIDQMFNQTLGLPDIARASETPGKSRAGGESGALAAMAQAPVMQQALEVETSLAKIGELILKVLRKEDKTVYVTDQGEKFSMSQIPEDVTVTVAAHSSSPLFAGALKQEAAEMLQAGIIDPEAYLELTDPPMKDWLLTRLKKRQQQEAQEKQGEEAMMIESLKQTPPPERAKLLASIFPWSKARTQSRK